MESTSFKANEQEYVSQIVYFLSLFPLAPVFPYLTFLPISGTAMHPGVHNFFFGSVNWAFMNFIISVNCILTSLAVLYIEYIICIAKSLHH